MATPHSRTQAISIARKPNYGGIPSEFTSHLVLESDYWMSILLEHFLMLQKASGIIIRKQFFSTYFECIVCFECTVGRNWSLRRGRSYLRVRIELELELELSCNQRYIFQKTSLFLFEQLSRWNNSLVKHLLDSSSDRKYHCALLATWYKKFFDFFW